MSESALIVNLTRPPMLLGQLRLPSDKSISHRALIANALAGGPAVIQLHAPGDDVRSTIHCLRQLGVQIIESASDDGALQVRLEGKPIKDQAVLDCGNSGTTMRLLAGALAGFPLTVTLDGDESLRARPMERVLIPLRQMGVQLAQSSNGYAPLRLTGDSSLQAIQYQLPLASAQLLGAIMLAGLSAEGVTQVVSPGPMRDHTQRLLAQMGADIRDDGFTTSLRGPVALRPYSLTVPGDLSAAAPWLVAASVHPQARLHLIGVSLNPTRLGLIRVLRRMGAKITIRQRAAGAEPFGNISVSSTGRLKSVQIEAAEAADLIDELPLLAVAMASVDGVSKVRGASELRVKESDRIATVAAGLASIGANVEELGDGWNIRRGRLNVAPAQIATHNDHRIAMAFAIARIGGVSGPVHLDNYDCVNISYPSFWQDLAQVCQTASKARSEEQR